ncbi:MAG: GNAT family N-acetyltransferase [Nitratireductor sp.]
MLDGRPAFVLPLSVKGKFLRKLSSIGGSHVNFSMGLYSREFLAAIGPGDMARIMRRVTRLVPGIGYVKLCCQPVDWRGNRNPMFDLPHQRAMNPAFMMTLAGGFEATLAHGNAKRKRKKFRQQCRIADEAGGWKFLVPRDVDGISRLLDVFIEQKSQRLREKGITDIFGARNAQLPDEPGPEVNFDGRAIAPVLWIEIIVARSVWSLVAAFTSGTCPDISAPSPPTNSPR